MTLVIDDRDLEKGPELNLGGKPPHGSSSLQPVAIIGALLVLFISGGAWWMSRRTPPAAGNTTPQAVTSTEAPIDRPGAPPVALPPLDDMDGFLRPLLAALSSRPELARWLATDDLVRQLAAAIDQAASGASAARDFKVIAPAAPFTTTVRGTRRTIDPASYRRYDGLVATITTMDATAAARVYRTIQPRLDEAYRSMGNRGGDVDVALQQALDILIDTPVVKDPIALVEGDGAAWAYADPEIEALTPTQKQLLRTGPANTDKLLVWLRALQSALQ